MFENYNYINEVFLVHVQRRTFNHTLPHVPISDNNEVRGSAFSLHYNKKNYIITCFHVIENAFHIALSSPATGSKQYKSKALLICPELDIAIIEIEDKKLSIPKQSLKPCLFPDIKNNKIPSPEIGSNTLIVGYPLGHTHLKITKGILSGQQNGLYQTDAPINGGNSGGPMMWENKVLGVNCKGYFLAQNIAYAIPIMRVIHLIRYHEKNPRDYHIRFPRNWGIQYTPPAYLMLPPSERKSHKKVDKDKCGVEILSVYDKQLMDKTSLKRGDILLKINNMPISNVGEIPLIWMRQKMTLHSLFYHIFLGQKISIEYISKSDNKTHQDTFVIQPENKLIVYRHWYSEHEKIPYLYLCGLVIIPFSVDFMDERREFLIEKRDTENPILVRTVECDDPTLIGKVYPKNWSKGHVIVSNVLKGSLISEYYLIKVGEIIDKIDNKPIHTIQDAENIIKRLLTHKKDIHISIMSGSTMNITYDTFITEEKHLMSLYDYNNPLYVIATEKSK